MGKMASIDFKTITAEAVLEISNMPLESLKCSFFNNSVTRIVMTPDLARQILLEKVWEKCVNTLIAQNSESESLAIEKALSILMKKDAIKGKIICRKNSFRVKLSNCQYRAYKQGVDGEIWACPWPSKKRYIIRITGSQFADFILQFDAEIPTMLTHIPAIVDTIRTREREEQKELMAEELKEKVVTSIIGQILEPLGLSVRYTMGEGDKVILDISQTLSAHIEIPLWQLPEKLKDPEAVMALLQVERPIEKRIDDDELDYDLFP